MNLLEQISDRLIQAVLVLVGTLLSDIALAWLDPRIRFAERS